MKPIPAHELDQFLMNESVLQEVARQMEKDMYPYIHWTFEQFYQTEYNHIIGALAKELKSLDQTNHSDLISMLYRIDLPQKSYETCMNSGMPHECLARQILNRELGKVLFRLHFDAGQK